MLVQWPLAQAEAMLRGAHAEAEIQQAPGWMCKHGVFVTSLLKLLSESSKFQPSL